MRLHIHSWSNWSEPFKVQMYRVVRLRRFNYTATKQERICEKCGAVEIKEIS